MIPSRERLREAIGTEWESSRPLADRAKVNRRAAGRILDVLYRQSLGRDEGVTIERRQAASGQWEYRKAATS